MNTFETWTAVLGWCSIINSGLLVLTTMALIAGRKAIAKIHGRGRRTARGGCREREESAQAEPLQQMCLNPVTLSRSPFWECPYCCCATKTGTCVFSKTSAVIAA